MAIKELYNLGIFMKKCYTADQLCYYADPLTGAEQGI